MKRMRWIPFVILIFLLAAAPLPSKSRKQPYPLFVHDRVTVVLDKLQADNDYPGAAASLQSIFDQAILYSPDDKLDALREADQALRMVTQLRHVGIATRDELLPYLRKHDALAGEISFLLRIEREKPDGVYVMLNKLREKRGDQLDKFVNLAAAVCLVHSQAYSRSMNENRVKSTDPIEIFDYYVKNESRMYFGIKNVPAELLVYVVDTTATVPEMEWALNKYANNSLVGKLFFDITYDYAYLKRGTDKTVTVKGYNLPNILKFGGVCIDQAYFATTVGKSIGVPTAIDTGSSAEAGHAWAGFLQSNGKVGFWNFDSGRYEAFKGVRGTVMDPQTREGIPDSYVSLLGEMIGTRTVDRQNCVVLTDAADRLIALEKETDTATAIVPPPADTVIASTFNTKRRAIDAPAELGLIELGLKQSLAYAPAWFTVRDLAVAKKLSLADKRRWSDILLKLGASRYPDFTLEVLMPMVQTIDDPAEQDGLLSKMLPLFKTRLDLSASILMAQASLWKAHDQTDRAGQYYMEIVQRYTNGGPFVLAALSGAEEMLKKSNRSNQIIALYEQAWGRTVQPKDMAQQFSSQSNWFRIGKRYAQKLTDAGDTTKAAAVESKLGGNAKG